MVLFGDRDGEFDSKGVQGGLSIIAINNSKKRVDLSL